VKKELDHWVLECFEETLRSLDVPASERPALGRDYLQAVARLGFAE